MNVTEDGKRDGKPSIVQWWMKALEAENSPLDRGMLLEARMSYFDDIVIYSTQVDLRCGERKKFSM
ncbi:hypothetical protein RvY_10872 [Ramazzottius varieornatus]|uniref:Uncharacterized protein n=1 Tax=Ramazzottius varieornatus TaxID=947166 RepID=A0A1D1VE81_RAMVA|nr:hypothetical protein RvY_10872 [Ramazzottius varieornatus]